MHIAFILDGNRRWAKSRGLTKTIGHRRGYQNFKNLLPVCHRLGVDTVTAYVLSTENIAERDKKELAGLFTEIKRVGADLSHFKKHEIRVQIFGNIRGLPKDVADVLRSVVRETKGFQKMTVNLAINYGGRDEIVRAAKKLAASGKTFTEQNFADCLDSAGQNDPDFVVRTGGKSRLSNFLPYQAAYSELYFTPVMWPAFDEVELQKALNWFAAQQRNFGK